MGYSVKNLMLVAYNFFLTKNIASILKPKGFPAYYLGNLSAINIIEIVYGTTDII